MRDSAGAALKPGSAAAACRPGWAGACPRDWAAERHRRRRTGCYPGRAPAAAGNRPRDRDDQRRAHPEHRDDQRPANRDAGEPCRGPGAADGWRWGRPAAAQPGARRHAHAPPEHYGLPSPARPSTPRRAPRRPPPRCREHWPAWPPGRARGPDGRGPSAWDARPDPGPGLSARPARWACRSPEARADGAAQAARSSSVRGRRWARQGHSGRCSARRERQPPVRRNRSARRGHHEAAGPLGPRPCWMRI